MCAHWILLKVLSTASNSEISNQLLKGCSEILLIFFESLDLEDLEDLEEALERLLIFANDVRACNGIR